MTLSTQTPDLSVIIPVGERHADATELLNEYLPALQQLGRSFELIIVLDGPRPHFRLPADLSDRVPLLQMQLSKAFGEATALMAGFEQSRGAVIVTLPAYFQIDAAGISQLVAGLERSDVVTGHRWPRSGSWFERLRRSAFHGMVSWVTALRFKDLGCRARALKRQVLTEITLYGDQHQFLPLLADRHGFRVSEIDVPQSPKDRFTGHYRNREYAHRFLDIFTVFFLVRFTKKPLRFFGMVGVSTFVAGALLLAWLATDRLIFDTALADRPILLLGALLVVLGLQLFALGLLGELIIFTHAKGIKDYQVDRVVEFADAPAENALQRRANS